MKPVTHSSTAFTFLPALPVGPFQCNCRLLICPKTGQAALIDPGDEPEKIVSFVQSQSLPNGISLQVKYLFHTHAHLDHIGGTRKVYERYASQAPLISLHKADEVLYQQLKMQGQLFGMEFEDPLPVQKYLEDTEELQVGSLKFSVIHTPGHSPGSVCFRLHEDSALKIPELIFSGDTLFEGSVGRTDLWGGDSAQLLKSIRTRILTLEDEIQVCPGHGPDTTVGQEKRENPFLA